MSEQLFICIECGLHYRVRETAEKCEAWCRETRSCNVEIAQQSVEYIDRQAQSDEAEV
jgi:hypothetical protein